MSEFSSTLIDCHQVGPNENESREFVNSDYKRDKMKMKNTKQNDNEKFEQFKVDEGAWESMRVHGSR